MRASGQDKFHGQVDGPCTVLYVEPGEKVEVECGYGQRAVVVMMPVEDMRPAEPDAAYGPGPGRVEP